MWGFPVLFIDLTVEAETDELKLISFWQPQSHPQLWWLAQPRKISRRVLTVRINLHDLGATSKG